MKAATEKSKRPKPGYDCVSCILHGAKDERVKPTTWLRGAGASGGPGAAQLPKPVDPEARFAPGDDWKLATPASASQPSNQATTLAKYLKEILEGRDEASALKACTQSGYGPRETWEELKADHPLCHQAPQGLSSESPEGHRVPCY